MTEVNRLLKTIYIIDKTNKWYTYIHERQSFSLFFQHHCSLPKKTNNISLVLLLSNCWQVLNIF